MTRAVYQRPPRCAYCTMRAEAIASKGARVANVCARHRAEADNNGASICHVATWAAYNRKGART